MARDDHQKLIDEVIGLARQQLKQNGMLVENPDGRSDTLLEGRESGMNEEGQSRSAVCYLSFERNL